MMHRALISTLIGACVVAPVMSAQRGPLPLRGIVYDSLRGHPVRDAFVTIAGGTRPITTDSRGRFRFDSVEPGMHIVTAQHALFDSIGLSGLRASAATTADDREILLSVPSFETLWHAACRGKVPGDSGIVFGTIRDAVSGRTVANAVVELSWWDLQIDRRKKVHERRWHVETRSNATGGYAVCGVAPDADLIVKATTDSSASGSIDLPPVDVRVQRRDLLAGPIKPSPSARGTIMGMVTDSDGLAVEDARIGWDGGNEIRTNAAGQFILSDVLAGTRKIEVLSIGAVPVVSSADVTAGDTTLLSLQVRSARRLNAIRTTANRNLRVFAADFDARRKRGFAYTRDSTELLKYNQFLDAIRDVPSMNVQYRSSTLTISVPDGKGGFCAPEVLIDGARAAFGHLIDLQPNEVGALEVYPRAAHIPERFLPTGIQPQCGMILVWTKYGFRNR